MLHPVELADFLAVLRNRPRVHHDEAPFWALFEPDGEAEHGVPRSLLAAASPCLLVALTTYRRPGPCTAVLDALARALAHAPPPRFHVLVLNDRSDADYAPVRAHARALFGDALTWLDARDRLGKPGFWKTYQTILLAARRLGPTRALFLQDDLTFAPTLLTDIEARWRATESDPKRRVLYLFSSDQDERFGRWVLFPRRELGEGLRLTQWFDLQAFYVDRAFFTLLDSQMVPVHPNRWRRVKSLSSGVGKQLTLRLFRRANIYQAHPPLVRHGAAESEMNPEARARRALDNRAR